MAGLTFSAGLTTPMALSAGVEASPLYLGTPDGNTRFLLDFISLTFAGNDPLAIPVQVTLARCTAGSGTYSNTIAAASIAMVSAGTELSRAVAKTVGTTPATKGGIIQIFDVHPQAGREIIFPLGKEPVIAGAGAIAVYVTAPADVNCLAFWQWQE